MVWWFEGQVLDQIVLVPIAARLLVSCVNLKKIMRPFGFLIREKASLINSYLLGLL